MHNQEFLINCKSQALADLQPSTKSSSLFFSQGLTHSGKKTGPVLFNDEYLRDGYIAPGKEKSSLLYFIITFLNTNYAQLDGQFIIPIIDAEAAKHVGKVLKLAIKNLPEFSINKINIADRKICCMIFSDIEQNQILTLIRTIGYYGALANKDTLIWLLSVAAQNNLKAKPVTIKDHYRLESINDLLNLNFNKDPRILDYSYAFYTNYISTLINSTCTNKIQPEILNRIFYKLNYVTNNSQDYEKFILGLELAFDDVTHVLCDQNLYQPKDLFKTINKQMLARFNVKPTQTLLTGSCMHAINIILRTAGTSKIYIAPSTYYEIYKSLNITPEYSQSTYVELKNHLPLISKPYQDEIVDLMILATNANVNRMHPGFGSNDINQIITNQLSNRDGKELTVIVDITLNNLNDPQLMLLFANFSKHINSGQLAIIFCTSLNKYFQVGFDRNAAGLSIGFYNPNKFANLHQTDCTPGFEPEDITLQIVTHSFTHGFEFIDRYYNLVHILSNYIYDKIIPKELFDQNKPIYIDQPHTQDIYEKTWSFLVIRFADVNISDLYLHKLQKFLTKQGIYLREGFAFSQTTYTLYDSATPPIIRISIGPDARANQFLALAEYLQSIIRDISKPSTHQRPHI